MIGIWSGSMDGSDINATDRSPSGKLLATADDFSSVNVFKYPAVHDGGSQHVKYSGHSSHVTCVRWLSEKCIVSNSKGMKLTDDYLISVGGDDKCVFQWKVVGSEDGASKIASSAREVEERLSEVVSIEEEFGAPTGGDEFMAVKPWLGAIVAPTAWTTPDPTKKDPFFAALGELSNRHQRLENIKANMSAKEIEGIYTDVRQVSERVLSKM